MNLSEKIRGMDFSAIGASLAKEATASLLDAFVNNSEDDDFRAFSGHEPGTRNERLSIIVSGYPGHPAFEMSMDVLIDEKRVGSYRYLVDLDLNFIDEFLVIF